MPEVHVTVAALAPLPLVPQLLQLVMSSSIADPCCPAGQASQAVAWENGFNVGFAMNVPGEQHPKRPLEPEDEENARDQHSVRVKPLPENTAQERVEQRTCENVRIVTRRTPVVVYIQQHNGRRLGHREEERERVHLL